MAVSWVSDDDNGFNATTPAQLWRAAQASGPWAAQGAAASASARSRKRQYASRWLIKDFHKALKTGLGAECLQLHTAPRLFAAVGVVALALVNLREHSCWQPNTPTENTGLSIRYL